MTTLVLTLDFDWMTNVNPGLLLVIILTSGLISNDPLSQSYFSSKPSEVQNQRIDESTENVAYYLLKVYLLLGF